MDVKRRPRKRDPVCVRRGERVFERLRRRYGARICTYAMRSDGSGAVTFHDGRSVEVYRGVQASAARRFPAPRRLVRRWL